MCVFGESKSAKRDRQNQTNLQQVAVLQQQQAMQEQSRIATEANALQAQNLAFAKEQSVAAAARQAEADKIAARPDAVNVAGANNQTVGDLLTNGMTGDTASSEDGTDSRRKGRRALRIDLAAPQVAGGTGINVPRG